MTWRNDAICAQIDPELWFPDGGDYRAAKQICATCPVTAECLAFALQNETSGYRYGVYGGLTAKQRNRPDPVTAAAARIRDCTECGTQFEARHPNILTCSEPCRTAAKRRRERRYSQQRRRTA